MGIFDGKDKRVEAIENELIVMGGNVTTLKDKSKMLENECVALVKNYGKLEQNHAKTNVEIDNLKCLLAKEKEKVVLLESEDREKSRRLDVVEMMLKSFLDEKKNIISELKENRNTQNGMFNIEDICKKTSIKGLQQTQLKYFLATKYNVYTIKINSGGNYFKLNATSNHDLHAEIRNHCDIIGNTLMFNESFLEFANKNTDSIKAKILEYRRKNKKYSDAREQLQKENTKNYNNKITEICGETRYNDYKGDRYGKIYKIVSNDYPNWEDLRNKYIEDNKCNPLYRCFPITKLQFLIKELQLGDYLLKIACELYA